jgi:hypothetical protein
MSDVITTKLGDVPGKKGMVISHERSGTHFLMNTLAMNFGYIAQPWINFDYQLGLNFYATKSLRRFFAKMRGKPILNLVKAHHQFAFFEPLIDELAEDFHIFYVYRDPRDVMASFRRMLSSLPWDEGPKETSTATFMRTAPRGALLRYQKDQVPTMLHRWQTHVEGWLEAAGDSDARIITLRYEDLNLDFDATVRSLGTRIGRPVDMPERPAKDENVVVAGSGLVGGHKSELDDADQAFVAETVGETMAK